MSLRFSASTSAVTAFAALACLLTAGPASFAQAAAGSNQHGHAETRLPLSVLPAPVVPDGFGVNIHFTHFKPEELQLFKDAGFGLVRMDLGWNGIEHAPGVYDFSKFDTLLDDLDSVGARALLILDYSNPLYDQGRSPYTDAGRAAFAKYAAAAAAHFAGRKVIWEIYNEPNGGFWTPKPDVNAYAALVKATVAAVRQTDPHALILAGATANLPRDYIEGLVRSGAMKGVDALSVHPYRDSNPETSIEDYNRTRTIMMRFTPPGQPLLPIICSEWGYSTNTKGISEQKQASYMVREYLANLAFGVNLTIFYDWKNDGPDPNNTEHRFGTLTQDLKPKPSYLAAKGLINSLRGYAFRHRLVANGANDFRLLFEGPADLAVVEWSSTDNGDNASLPAVRKVAPGDPEYDYLKRAASIRYSPEPRITLTTPLVPAAIRVTNPGDKPVTIVIKNRERLRRLVVAPHETSLAMTSLFVDFSAPNPQKIDLSISWNGEPVNLIEPLTAFTGSVFDLAVGPRGSDLMIDVVNPLTTAFTGKLILKPAKGKTIDKPLTLAAGERKTVTFPGAAAGAGKIEVQDKAAFVWARGATENYVPKPGWPASVSQRGPYNRVFYLKNNPTTNSPAEVVATDPGAPAAVAVAFPYETGDEWRYYTLEPVAQELIPAGAKALVLWACGDGAAVAIRARFIDSTGQTFQPDGGRITWTGWRPVTLRLDGGSASHWGGANDGIPHGQLHWSAVTLLDASSLPTHVGRILLAAPVYAMP
ncbi:MAG: cellulase family glycosylhydrolase [Capsulimonadaceae bacterium]|nr:cellulase family glycosylhydrolase [Capsulimonadaceae bacterium]